MCLFCIQSVMVSLPLPPPSGPHPQPTLLYRSDGLCQPVASQLTLASTRYGQPPSGYHLPPGATTTSFTHLPSQSYFIGSSTSQISGHHHASFQPRQHIQGLAYGQAIATGSPQASYISGTPSGAQSSTTASQFNVGYGHSTTTSSYSPQSSQLHAQSLMPPSERLSSQPPGYDSTPPDSYSSPHTQHSTGSRHQWSSQSFQ